MIKLITNDYLNEACFLSLNIDDKKYLIALKDAQMDLEDVLGAEFYSEIETQYNAETLSTDNNTLYENYIKDYLAWNTYYHYLKFSNADATPTGIREFNDENSTVLSDVKMFAFEKNVLQKANRFKYKMMNYLKIEQAKDSTKYPKYYESCKGELSFAISAVDKKSDALIKVNKAINSNE